MEKKKHWRWNEETKQDELVEDIEPTSDIYDSYDVDFRQEQAELRNLGRYRHGGAYRRSPREPRPYIGI